MVVFFSIIWTVKSEKILRRYVSLEPLIMHLSMFRLRGRGVGGGTGKGAAFEHFCCPLYGEFDLKFGSMLRTFELDRAED